jgi:hypothetical protein
MTKTEMVLARKAEMNKEVDATIKEIVEINNRKKELEKELRELKIAAEAKYFSLPVDVKERIEGNDYYMLKIPCMRDKEFKMPELKVLLESAGINENEVIEKQVIEVVNENKLKELVKEEKLTQEMINKTIKGTKYYRSEYGTIDK